MHTRRAAPSSCQPAVQLTATPCSPPHQNHLTPVSIQPCRSHTRPGRKEIKSRRGYVYSSCPVFVSCFGRLRICIGTSRARYVCRRRKSGNLPKMGRGYDHIAILHHLAFAARGRGIYIMSPKAAWKNQSFLRAKRYNW